MISFSLSASIRIHNHSFYTTIACHFHKFTEILKRLHFFISLEAHENTKFTSCTHRIRLIRFSFCLLNEKFTSFFFLFLQTKSKKKKREVKHVTYCCWERCRCWCSHIPSPFIFSVFVVFHSVSSSHWSPENVCEFSIVHTHPPVLAYRTSVSNDGSGNHKKSELYYENNCQF